MILLKPKYSRIWPFLIVRVFPDGGGSPPHQPKICSFPPHLEKFSPPSRFLLHIKSICYLENPDSWHSPFLIAHYSPFQKGETLESWHKLLLSNWSRLLIEKDLELSPSSPNGLKDSKNYCPWLYLSVGQVWWLNELWFKRYIQKCTTSHVLIAIMTSQIW